MKLLIIGEITGEVTKACKIASSKGADIINATNTDEAFEKVISGNSIDAIMVDVKQDIASLVTNLKRERVSATVLAYGIDADSKQAVAAIKAGAEEYIPLPPEEELIAAILESISCQQEEVISSSLQMQNIITLAQRIAPSDANVLITGQSGTGKEVISRYIHNQSNRKAGNFVSLNCAAIPDNLLESELFGHEKGAFTGALNRRIGKFEESHNGTLLLDEISEMDIRLQAKLLRAIQEKEITRVGGNNTIKLNIRIIATSNRDLKEEVKKGNFREDLLFRLNVIHLDLPPLKERKEDIIKFAEHFVNKFSKANGMEHNPPKLDNDAIRILQQYTWPGNVRELENTIHRAVLLNNDGIIDATSLLMPTGQTSNWSANGLNADDELEVGQSIGDMERKLILKTLDYYSGNRSTAANILGISIRTLQNKLKEYNQC